MEINMILGKNPKVKVLNFGFSEVNFTNIISLAKVFDKMAVIDILAGTIDVNDLCIDKCKEASLSIKQNEEYADIDVRKQVDDKTLLQALLLIQEMEPEQLNITIFPKDDFEKYYCKINVLYYENVATVFCDRSICKKEILKLFDDCFK